MSDIDRPCGEIDVLIGADYYELLPTVIQMNKGFKLLENHLVLVFGVGIVSRVKSTQISM